MRYTVIRMSKVLAQAYDELDEALVKVMTEFWKKYPEEFWKQYPKGAVVGYSGSVRHGTWSVERDSQIFDGLKFRLDDDQMHDLIINDEVKLSHKDMVSQDKYHPEYDKNE